MKKALRKNVSFFIAFALLMSAFFVMKCDAEESENLKPIKVGVIYFGEGNEEAQRSYYREYFSKLDNYLEFFGYRTEYSMDSSRNVVNNYNNGEYDVVVCSNGWFDRNGGFHKLNRKLPEKCSTKDVCKSRIAMFINEDNDEIFYDDLRSINQKKIGILNNEMVESICKSYVYENKLDITYTMYDTTLELSTALKNGEIDIAVTDYDSEYFSKIVAVLADIPMHFAAKVADSELFGIIKSAEAKLLVSEPDIVSKLYGSYFTSQNYFAFTAEETEFIRNSPTIKVAVATDFSPNEYIDDQGVIKGVNVDYLKLIAEKSGLKFSIEKLSDDHYMTEQFNQQHIDMMLHFLQSENSGELKEAKLTAPYKTTEAVAVGKYGMIIEEDEKITAALNGRCFSFNKYIEAAFPQWEIDYYNSDLECLDAVYNGRADIIIQDSTTIQELLSANPYAEIGSLATITGDINVSFAVADIQNADLIVSIINKTISQISDTELRAIELANAKATVAEPTIGDIFRENIYWIASAVIIIVASMVIIIIKAGVKSKSAKNRSDFMAKMSHEIRTPLNGIIGMSQLAEEKSGDPIYVSECLGKINASSKHLLELINEILDYSKIDSNKMTIVPARFNLLGDIEYLSNEYRTVAAMKGVRFTTILRGCDVDFVIGDSLRFRQIVMNILSNAVKFTAAGKNVTFEVKKCGEENGYATFDFSVFDEGIGIQEKNLRRVFNSFEQENVQKSSSSEGTGLGLSIAKKLAELMNGTITAESKVGVGSTFVVTLPFKICADGAESDSEEIPDRRRYALTEEYPNFCSVGIDKRQEGFIAYQCRKLGVNYSAFAGFEGLLTNSADLTEPYVLLIEQSYITGRNIMRTVRKSYQNSRIIAAKSDNITIKTPDDVKPDGIVTLPLFPQSLKKVLNAFSDSEQVVQPESAMPLAGLKIMVVEDNELNMEIACELLEMCGAECDKAENGAIAVNTFMESKIGYYDLILMDIRMPEMDGLEATTVIRGSDRADAKSVAIIAMSANAFDTDAKRSKEAGMDDHLVKPIEMDKVISTINRVVRGYK